MTFAILVALGIGLLIGLERERKKGEGPDRAVAGIRTFAIAALLGVVAALTGESLLIAVMAIGVVAFIAVGYARRATSDPGLTTEIALLITYALGALAATQVKLAAVLGVLVALLLVSRSALHDFARKELTDRELQDAIMLAAAAVVVLPLLPDRAIDPWGALNPQLVWRLTVIVMMINAAGYVALRLIGTRWGLPLTGLLGGFVSSAAVIAAMGERHRSEPVLERPAIAAAALSSVATVLQLAIILLASNPRLLLELAPALTAMAVVAGAAGLLLTRRVARSAEVAAPLAGRAFRPRLALSFAALLAVMLLGVSALHRYFGSVGALAAAVIGGFFDAHSSAASIASLAAGGSISADYATVGVGLGISTNTLTKLAMARAIGGSAYLARLAPSLLAMLGAFWLGWAVVILA